MILLLRKDHINFGLHFRYTNSIFIIPGIFFVLFCSVLFFNQRFFSHSNYDKIRTKYKKYINKFSQLPINIWQSTFRSHFLFILFNVSMLWRLFQLFTAGLMIYSTFAAIYYSKVNPVVGDYDYTAYLGGARSMADDPEPLPTTSTLSELGNSYIFQTAAHGFQFVLDAIEKIPKT